MPGMQSFCIYAAVGIFFIFIFQCTFFIGWFVIDQQRLEEVRESCFCSKMDSDWKPSSCSQTSALKIVFEKIAVTLLFFPVKVFVVLVTCVLLGFASYGVSQLERNFDAGSYIEEGTYLRRLYFQSFQAKMT